MHKNKSDFLFGHQSQRGRSMRKSCNHWNPVRGLGCRYFNFGHASCHAHRIRVNQHLLQPHEILHKDRLYKDYDVTFCKYYT